MLRHLVNVTRFPVSVLDLAAGPTAGQVCASPSLLAGFEKHTIQTNPRCWTSNHQAVDAVTIDQLVDNLRLAHVEHLSIDTEGWDALILEGGRRSIKNRTFSMIEFEYSGRWKERGSTLRAVQNWLFASGYHCFWLTSRGATRLIPLSGPCWLPEFENHRWSNVACVHRTEYVELLYNRTCSVARCSTLSVL